MTKIHEFKRKIDTSLLELAESVLEQVKSGEIVGMTVLATHQGNSYGHRSAGEQSLGDVVVALDSWKFEQYYIGMMEREGE